MNEVMGNSLFFGVMISVAAYEMGVLLKRKFKLAIFNPLLIAIAVIIVILAITGVEYYPDITSIEVTSDYTLFTITLESDVMNTYESMLVMSFYTAGNEQQIAAGVSPEDVKTTVRYINGSTNEIISETDSSTMITE